jgi:hypothetical protein
MCTACYALRNIKHIVPIDTLSVIYFAHIHSIISYAIIFWGSSSYANNIFMLQKKIIRIITNTRPRNSCREVFKSMEIMMLYSQYIYSLVLYTINPSAWGHLNPSSYCDVGRLFYGVFKLWSKLKRKK